LEDTLNKIESFSLKRHDENQVKRILSLENLELRQECTQAVALVDDKIVGCIGFDVTTGEIFHVVVDPDYRGRHIARHLIEYITSRVHAPLLKAKGCIAFYEACGFSCEGDFCYRVNQTKRCC
jgi:N-acetylglutamate synthase-like GNAT family acetyltransferase